MKKTKIKPPPDWENAPQSFERFERLARGLLAVPKKELDKELATHERTKERTQKAKRKNHERDKNRAIRLYSPNRSEM